MQTQTSNALHNAIMEAGGKDHPPMLALGNYIQWKSRIKRYIDTKPNHELIYYCLQNPPYEYKWTDKAVLVVEGSFETTTERKFTSRNDESLELYYSRFYKMINELVRNQCDVTIHQSQELKSVSYHKLYDIRKQHQNEVNEIRAERLARTTNPLTLVAQQQPVYLPQNHPTHYTQNYSTRSQQAATRNRGKAIVNSPPPIYDQEPSIVVEDDEIANQDNSPRINRGTGYDNQRIGNVAGARQNVEQADWRDDTDDEPDDQELKAHYIEHPEQSNYVNDTYSIEQDEHNVNIDSLDMSYDREQIDQDDDLANERHLLASLIEKLKCEIDDSKNRNKFLETSNKALVDKLKGEIEEFKTKNKSLESSNNHFKKANNEQSKTNQLMFKDLMKFQAELDRYHDVKYVSKVA
nr:hypothetical protein [Tanacetum cinerariifolium]